LPKPNTNCEAEATDLVTAITTIKNHGQYMALKQAFTNDNKRQFAAILRTMNIDPLLEAKIIDHAWDANSVSFKWV